MRELLCNAGSGNMMSSGGAARHYRWLHCGRSSLCVFSSITDGGCQIAPVVIQLALSAFGAAGMVQAGIAALQHATAWLNTAWTAQGNKAKVTVASKELLHMLVSLAMTALAYTGAKGNFGNALKIA